MMLSMALLNDGSGSGECDPEGSKDDEVGGDCTGDTPPVNNDRGGGSDPKQP